MNKRDLIFLAIGAVIGGLSVAVWLKAPGKDARGDAEPDEPRLLERGAQDEVEGSGTSSIESHSRAPAVVRGRSPDMKASVTAVPRGVTDRQPEREVDPASGLRSLRGSTPAARQESSDTFRGSEPKSPTVLLFEGSRIEGHVAFEGTLPEAMPIDMKSDPRCQATTKDSDRFSDDYKGEQGHLADVFVYVEDAPPRRYDPPATPIVLDQRGCRFLPKVFGIMTGQPLEIVNSDPTLHSVHAYAHRGEFSQVFPKEGQRSTRRFKERQVLVSIGCEVHRWMQAYAGVLDHPFFATTGREGTFQIGGLPEGQYTVVARHPKLGEKRASVSVQNDQASRLEFSFAAPR